MDRYFYHLMLSQTVQSADKGELRNQARLMVDSKLSDRKKTNTDTPVGRTQSIGDSAKTGHRASGSIESAEDLGLDAPNASTEGVKLQEKF